METVIQSPSEEEEGVVEYSATFENDIFEKQAKEQIIQALKELTVLRLPAQLKHIEDYAFAGVVRDAVIVPAECESIGSGAFAGCENLKYVKLLGNTTYETDSFDKGVVIDDNR